MMACMCKVYSSPIECVALCITMVFACVVWGHDWSSTTARALAATLRAGPRHGTGHAKEAVRRYRQSKKGRAAEATLQGKVPEHGYRRGGMQTDVRSSRPRGPQNLHRVPRHGDREEYPDMM